MYDIINDECVIIVDNNKIEVYFYKKIKLQNTKEKYKLQNFEENNRRFKKYQFFEISKPSDRNNFDFFLELKNNSKKNYYIKNCKKIYMRSDIFQNYNLYINWKDIDCKLKQYYF